jgi:protein involved in polysaccharide export with SLBB domain
MKTQCCAVVLAVCIGLGVIAAQTPAAQEPESAAPAPQLQEYVLQRGDEITIKVFNNSELLDTVVVRPDGKITVILLDDVEAAGLTAAGLDAQLTAGYSKFFREPQVSVIVRSFSNLRVYVGGEVGTPGPVSLKGDITALEAILQVGGFRPTARMDSVILLRNDGKDRPMAQKLNFKELLSKGGSDIALQPFDVLYVPVSRIAKVDRFVDQYIRQLIPISMTGGFTYVLGDRQLVVPQ